MLRPLVQSIVDSRQSIVKPKAMPVILAILSGIILALPFCDGRLWIFAWFGFLPLLLSLKNKSALGAFRLSFLTGVIFWSLTIYWLVHVTLVGTILLVLYLALYFGIFGFLLCTIGYRLSAIDLFLTPAIWVSLEYLRAHLATGFPWALLGYSQYKNLAVIQIADITGAWGVSFLVMIVNAAIYSVVSRQSSAVSARKKHLFLAALCLIFTLIYGYYKIYRTPGTEQLAPVKISVIQGNIPQELKWEAPAREFILEKYLRLSKEALADKPDLIIWPEAALPVVLEEEPLFFRQVEAFSTSHKIPLLLGAVTSSNKLYYNSAIFIAQPTAGLFRYDKLHLVPFGEYIPLKTVFPFLKTIVPIGDINRGKDYTVFKLITGGSKEPLKFSVLICFEDVFGRLSSGFIKEGAQLLVNITNDAWYKKTSAPYQHLQASVFRAVENRLYLVRAANTGISGFIAPSGKIISLVADKKNKNIFVDGYKTQEVIAAKYNASFYTHHGDVFIWICSLFALYCVIMQLVTKKFKT